MRGARGIPLLAREKMQRSEIGACVVYLSALIRFIKYSYSYGVVSFGFLLDSFWSHMLHWH